MERINAELARQIAKVIAEDIKDPRLGDAIIGVTKVHTTSDLKYAKVYLSVYAPTQELITEAYYTVCRAATFIRNRLKDSVQIRLLPELKFFIDDTIAHSVKIEELLAKIRTDSVTQDNAEDDSDNQ